jgi:hypothetical protein
VNKGFSAAVFSCLFAAFLTAAVPREARAQEPAATPAPAQAGAAVSAEEAGRGTRVPLAQVSTAFDAAGREALSATLLTQTLAGTAEAPVRNVRLVLRNAGQSFYNYVAGYATFYDEGGVRCGAGLFAFGAAAPGERVEADTPGLRLTCAPAAWRVVATTLLTAAGDAAQPPAPARPAAETTPGAPAAATPADRPALPPLEINVNGRTIPVQLNNPLEIVVGAERVRIVVQPAP